MAQQSLASDKLPETPHRSTSQSFVRCVPLFRTTLAALRGVSLSVSLHVRCRRQKGRTAGTGRDQERFQDETRPG